MKKVLFAGLVIGIIAMTLVALNSDNTTAQSRNSVWDTWTLKLTVKDSVNLTSAGIVTTSAFVGDSLVKSIAVSGGQTTDKYFVTNTGVPGDSTTAIAGVVALAGYVQVYRLGYTPAFTKAEAGQTFAIFRSK